ncbi:MAG: GNAT family N-acetyltransferase, partial [Amphritea sp.]|nr:GNAT family N-acetyltransferase [Amphritea sp.]MBQ0783863.1 GNAT family N-acetyltransferase [Amphritea sp.]
GYASEIGRGQINYGFEQLGSDRLLAAVAPKNKASRNVLIKLGMSHRLTVETEDRGMREIYVIERHPASA